ncbi:MAG: hypothetical protein C4521_10930 [Actinobacteria bacterium]|nr:MAG: hypothetical protein C4521_10930 [Actinomycetota bacterium]
MTSKAAIIPVVDLQNIRDREGRDHAPAIAENFMQILRLLSGHLTYLHIADKSIVRDLLGSDVFLCRYVTGRCTGDGTANRVVTISDDIGPFTPTELRLLAKNDVNEFYSRDDGTEILSWYRLASGAAGGNTLQWQGIVPNGFKCGSDVESLSNKTGQVYSYLAMRRG